MNKLNFDGRLLERKDVQRKLRDLAYEMDFSGEEPEPDYFYSFKKVYYHKGKREFFIRKNCN